MSASFHSSESQNTTPITSSSIITTPSPSVRRCLVFLGRRDDKNRSSNTDDDDDDDDDEGKLAIVNPFNIQRILQQVRHRVTQLSCGYNHALLLVANTAYTFGNNSYGQCGVNFNELHQIVAVPGVPTSVSSVSTGAHHSIAITNSGQVYMWGRNDKGQLGIGSADPYRNEPCLLVDFDNAQYAAGGDHHSAIVTTSGKVYTCGYNGIGELGYSTEDALQVVPRSVCVWDRRYPSPRISACACGTNHTIFLDKSTGLVYSCGRLGEITPQMPPKTLPTVVEELATSKIKGVACNSNAVLALTKGGRLFVWGSGDALGTGTFKEHRAPYEIKKFRRHNVKRISCGTEHMAAITSDGSLYTWGRNQFGQSGHAFDRLQGVPSQITAFKRWSFARIACGGRFTLAWGFDDERKHIQDVVDSKLAILPIPSKFEWLHLWWPPIAIVMISVCVAMYYTKTL